MLPTLGLMAGAELSDELAHALFAPSNAGRGLSNAQSFVHFEAAHGIWVEPGIQRYFAGTHHLWGLTIGWQQVTAIADTIYGFGHVGCTLLFALWVYRCRTQLFSFLSSVFLLTNLLAVLLYEAFPLAPPRLARGLRYGGHPFHFVDTVFGAGSSVKVGFNEYASMPSVQVAWALIVGLTLCWTARHEAIRILAPLYPALMVLTVVVTGNHYLLDAIGAVVVVGLAVALASGLHCIQIRWRSPAVVARELHALRHGLSAVAPPLEEDVKITIIPERLVA